MREVCRSEPTFRRGLLFASSFFITLFLADLFLFGDLAFRDLSHRVIDQAFGSSLRALELQLPSTLVDEQEGPEGAPIQTEDCPQADPQTPARPRACPRAPRRDSLGPHVFRSLNDRLQRIVTDLEGRVLWRGIEQGSGTEPVGVSAEAAPLPVGHGAVHEQWDVGDQRRDVIALRRPGEPEEADAREIGIPRDLIVRDLERLKADLQMKLWIGAGLAVLILLLAFLYVLRLLNRTRLLEAQAQMDDRLAFIGGLAAGLAHEIRNPLNVLSMNLQMLEEEIAGPQGGQGEEARAYVATLQGEIRRLSNLVNNFLSYARPNQMRFEMRDLNQVLEEICRLVRPEFETRQLQIRQDLSPYMPPVDLDDAQIRQAIMNIVINATQILKPGGVVTIRSRVGPEGEAIVSIEDNGPGVRPEDKDRIFDLFYSTRGGGTGLGLPIAARILEAHGGSITVESEPGKGARFILKLPRRHAAGAATAGSATALAAPGGS